MCVCLCIYTISELMKLSTSNTNLHCKCHSEVNTYKINIQAPKDVALCYGTQRLCPYTFNAPPIILKSWICPWKSLLCQRSNCIQAQVRSGFGH